MSNEIATDIAAMSDLMKGLLACPPLRRGFELQVATQKTFYELAARISGSQCPVSLPMAEVFCIERNFFSTFFLAVTCQIAGDSEFLPLYAMVNQGMRAWVTACDNILDDEYKEIFSFDIPQRGSRIRSVLTLLLADRVVTEFIADTYGDNAIIKDVGQESLRALVPCALQECDEEQRPVPVLPPGEILNDIHKRKTADLFAAPLALPLAMESIAPDMAVAALTALRSFGSACQIVDDVKDMSHDVATGRHNLLVSITSEQRADNDQWLGQLRDAGGGDWAAWERFPAAVAVAAEGAVARFGDSFEALSEIGIGLSQGQKDAVVTCIFSLLKVPCELIPVRGEGG